MPGGRRSSNRSREARPGKRTVREKAAAGSFVQETEFGRAEVRVDRRRPGGRLLLVDGQESSYVDLEDPTNLDFAYVRRIGDLLDLHAPAGAPLHVVHVGGGGFTLPRYVAATRPGSRSLTFERDGGLVDVAREALGLRTSARMRVRVGDGRELLGALPGRSADAVVVDAFDGPLVPAHLATVEFAREMRRVLRAGGLCVLNVIDIPPLEFARAGAATLLAAFGHGAILAPRRLLHGREGGNVVLAASSRELPLAGLRERAARADQPEAVLAGPELVAFTGGARPMTDARRPTHRLAQLADLWSRERVGD
jgi:spermidine synthase